MNSAKRYGLAALLVFCTALHAQDGADAPPADSRAPLSKSEKLKRLREAMRGGGGDVAPATAADRKKKNVPPPPPEDMRERAFRELRPKTYSDKTEAGTAVVRTRVIEAADPVYNFGLQLGVALQPYSPRGEVPMVTLGRNDLSRLDSTWMPAVELRYAPWTPRWLGHHALGFRIGAGYARQDVTVRGPTGADLGATRLHSLHSYAFLSQEWVFTHAPRWGWALDLGGSRFDVIQTGANPLTDASDSVWLALLRTGPTYRVGDFWFSLGYERRQPTGRSKWAQLEADAVVIGALYGIR